MSRARALTLASFFAVVTGCSLSSEGTADPSGLGGPPPPDDGAVSSDTSVPLDDTSLPVEDTGAPIDSTIDSSLDDTSVTDTEPVDTGSPDTEPVDTGSPDTEPVDTGSPDTGTPDTGVVDTGVVDTGAPDTSPVGVLVGSSTNSVSGTVSLSTVGTLDWAHWGLVKADSFNHKSGASLITKGTTGGGPSRYDGYPIKFSWTDGQPTANVSETATGIYHDKKDEHFTFEAAGSEATERTLQVWVTWNGGSGSVSARLTDGSAPPWTGNLPVGDMGIGVKPAMFTFKFRPATPGQKLVVKVTQTTGSGYVSLLAAALK